jgi:hypothetical protein
MILGFLWSLFKRYRIQVIKTDGKKKKPDLFIHQLSLPPLFPRISRLLSLTLFFFPTDKSSEEGLLLWAKKTTAGYRDVNVESYKHRCVA